MQTRNGEALACRDGQIGFRYVRQDREEKNRGLAPAQAAKFPQNAAKFRWWKELLRLPANSRIWRKAPFAMAAALLRPNSVSTVILAPMASRLLSFPERRKEMTGGSSGSTFFRYRNCGLLRFFKTTSNRPSWSKSPRANVRLSSKKSSPAIPETSEKVPSRLFM